MKEYRSCTGNKQKGTTSKKKITRKRKSPEEKKNNVIIKDESFQAKKINPSTIVINSCKSFRPQQQRKK